MLGTAGGPPRLVLDEQLDRLVPGSGDRRNGVRSSSVRVVSSISIAVRANLLDGVPRTDAMLSPVVSLRTFLA